MSEIKNRLESKIIRLFLGDSSDEASGIPLIELRLKKDEYESEYFSRKAKIVEAIMNYFDCFNGENALLDPKSIDELGKFIEFMWNKFEPNQEKDIISYIKTSFKRIAFSNDKSELKDYSIEDKIKKWEKRFESARPELIFDIQNTKCQELLAEILLEDYYCSHPDVDEIAKYQSILKKIKEAARINRISFESMEYADPNSDISKIDDLNVIKLNTVENSDVENNYKLLFDKIQQQYNKSQDRIGKNTKSYLSSLITIRLIREKNKTDTLDMLFFDLMEEYEFSDKILLVELKYIWNMKQKFPKQKEIAARFIRNSTGNERKGDDASRYLKSYVSIMKEYI